MLLRLAYLGLTNAFALLRLLPGSDRDKDVEILALRHQLAVLQRQRVLLVKWDWCPVERTWRGRCAGRHYCQVAAGGAQEYEPVGPKPYLDRLLDEYGLTEEEVEGKICSQPEKSWIDGEESSTLATSSTSPYCDRAVTFRVRGMLRLSISAVRSL